MHAMGICGWLWTSLLTVWVILMLRRKETQERESVGSRLSYSVPTVLAFYLLFGGNIPYAWLHLRILPLAQPLQTFGVALTVLGIAFAIWARFYIGENWSGSVTVKIGHELIRSGPYAWVRHPIYSGLLLATLGTALVRDEVRGALAIPILWIAFRMKSRIEETFMMKTFGPAYTEYSKSTGALIPRLH
jgi:protein-S-isoprenylcysteine O-methyltransferase Ste14